MRVKNGFNTRKRRKKILKLAKGYRTTRGNLFKNAKEAVVRAHNFAFRDRKVRKRSMRRLWILRINIASRMNGMTYSKFVGLAKKNNIEIDRKMLAELAVSDMNAFKKIIEKLAA